MVVAGAVPAVHKYSQTLRDMWLVAALVAHLMPSIAGIGRKYAAWLKALATIWGHS
jgi:hypothetical protein